MDDNKANNKTTAIYCTVKPGKKTLAVLDYFNGIAFNCARRLDVRIQDTEDPKQWREVVKIRWH
jgi:hypothetical protein